MTDGSIHTCAAAHGRPGGPVGPSHLWGFAAGPVSCQLLELASQMLVEEALLQCSEAFSDLPGQKGKVEEHLKEMKGNPFWKSSLNG